MYYLEKASVPKAIAHMSIPMILGMVVNMVYNITDAYFIGRLNNTAMLASITLALPFTTILMHRENYLEQVAAHIFQDY